MAYKIVRSTEPWQPRRGLEGPYRYANGRVLYWDPREGSYWDPTTDWFVPRSEVQDLHQTLLDRIRQS